MARDIVFFLAPDDRKAAATYRRGPGAAMETVTCCGLEPDTAIAQWDQYFEEPSAPVDRLLGWPWPQWVGQSMNDSVEGGSAHRWQFAIYRASHDDYQDSLFPTGLSAGTCEDALDTACGLYLSDPTAWT